MHYGLCICSTWRAHGHAPRGWRARAWFVARGGSRARARDLAGGRGHKKVVSAGITPAAIFRCGGGELRSRPRLLFRRYRERGNITRTKKRSLYPLVCRLPNTEFLGFSNAGRDLHSPPYKLLGQPALLWGATKHSMLGLWGAGLGWPV